MLEYSNWTFRKEGVDYTGPGYQPRRTMTFWRNNIDVEPEKQVIYFTDINLLTNEKVEHAITGNVTYFDFEEDHVYYVTHIIVIDGDRIQFDTAKLPSIHDCEPHTKVYGRCNNKCQVEVIPKDDTGWLTFVNAVEDDNYVISEPIQYRRRGGVAYLRGRIKKVFIPKNTSEYTYLLGTFEASLPPTDIIHVLNTLSITDYSMTAKLKLVRANNTWSIQLAVTIAPVFPSGSGISATFDAPFCISYPLDDVDY